MGRSRKIVWKNVTVVWMGVMMAVLSTVVVLVVEANPAVSEPYIAFWNYPFMEDEIPYSKDPTSYDDNNSDNEGRPAKEECPLAFPISWTYHTRRTMHTPPILMIPSSDHHHHYGKTLLLTTDYEFLDRITTTSTFREEEDDYPLLMEGNNLYYTSPTLYTNDDGKEEAILVNYDGDLLFVGLDYDDNNNNNNMDDDSKNHRLFLKYPLPRLSVRHLWVLEYISSVEEGNAMNNNNNNIPLHSYFEDQFYNYNYNRNNKGENYKIQSANILHQSPQEEEEEEDLPSKTKPPQKDKKEKN